MASKEREELLAKAELVGLVKGEDFKPNVSDDKLIELIDVKMNGGETTSTKKELTAEEKEANIIAVQRKEWLKLRRVMVSCNDKNMKDYTTSPIYSISNSIVNMPKLTVPFNVETHVPQAFYELLKGKITYIDVKGTDSKGRPVTRKKPMPMYNVQDLPDLTPDELKKLQQEQAMRKGE